MIARGKSAVAAALEHARATASPASQARRPDSVAEADEIAAVLYGQLVRGGARQIGWKLGATDAAVQRRLGAEAPFVAPVFDVMSATLSTPVSLSTLVAPVLEVEIGLEFTSDGVTVRSCVELADSRYPDWASSLPEALADFGLQGLMLVGEEIPPAAVVSATVSRDGETCAEGARGYDEALALAQNAVGAHELDRAGLVATGTITPPVPLVPGSWTVDLHELGCFTFEVTS